MPDLLSVVEGVGALCSLLAVWFLRRQSILYWPFNLACSIVYLYVFYQKGIYAQSALQLVYIGLCIYGIYEWLKHVKKGITVDVFHMPKSVFLGVLGVGTILSTIFYFVLDIYTDSTVPILDGILTSFSMIGTWLFTRRYVETWLIWIVIDVVGIILYIPKGLYQTAGLYLIFIGMATQGYFLWKKSIKEKVLK